MQIFIGMKLYRENYNRNQPVTVSEHTITKIGRKYFEIDNNDRYKIEIETLHYNDKIYTQNNFQLYRSEQEIRDKNERIELYRLIRTHFDYSQKNTLQDYRKIAEILGIK